MKFIISKTSSWGDKPIENCSEELVTYIDRRTVSTIEKARNYNWFNRWFEAGINHRVENGNIACDRIKKLSVFVVDFSDMDNLMSFIKENGKVIISQTDEYKEIEWKIEIYDDYRE